MKPQVVVFGLDGATFTVAVFDDLVARSRAAHQDSLACSATCGTPTPIPLRYNK
jgi:hypothetical protein